MTQNESITAYWGARELYACTVIEYDGVNAESEGADIWTADFQNGRQGVKSISVLSTNTIDRISEMTVTALDTVSGSRV